MLVPAPASSVSVPFDVVVLVKLTVSFPVVPTTDRLPRSKVTVVSSTVPTPAPVLIDNVPFVRVAPVMLTVCNRTETAARVEHYFAKGHAQWPELHDAARTFRVDSKVLEKAELGETASSDKDYELRLKEIMEAARIPESRKEALRAMKKEELLRELVDTVGKRDQAGQDLQNVVSVAMLSEGWDAKNVTHIMGLRAFTSQLLCEQVIGRSCSAQVA